MSDSWINLKEWNEDMRGAWQHYDLLATSMIGIAATILTLVYLGHPSFWQESAKLLSFVTLLMNLWSVSIRKLKHYYYKINLVFASYIPFGMALLIVLVL